MKRIGYPTQDRGSCKLSCETEAPLVSIPIADVPKWSCMLAGMFETPSHVVSVPAALWTADPMIHNKRYVQFVILCTAPSLEA